MNTAVLTKEMAREARELMKKKTVITGRCIKLKQLSANIGGNQLDTEVIEVMLPGNIIGICDTQRFDSYMFRTLGGFIGYDQPFIIEEVTGGHIILNRIEARAILRGKFWDAAEEGMEVIATLSSFNAESGNFFVDIFGQTAWMRKDDWDHNYIPSGLNDIDKELGDDIRVKVVRFSRDEQLVQVSQKALYPDPWVGANDLFHVGELAAGEVINISLADRSRATGYFVRLEGGPVIRCTLATGTAMPSVNDSVNLRIEKMDEEFRRGKGTILKINNRKESLVDATSKFNIFLNATRATRRS